MQVQSGDMDMVIGANKWASNPYQAVDITSLIFLDDLMHTSIKPGQVSGLWNLLNTFSIICWISIVASILFLMIRNNTYIKI